MSLPPLLMADLGVTRSHSRPSVSNDNPYSESQFKTMKYRPEFPERFGSIVVFCLALVLPDGLLNLCRYLLAQPPYRPAHR
jgi:transposase InsO family protein